MSEAAWVRIQRKTFTRWCNNFLGQRQMGIELLEKDLADGVALHNLLEILSNETITPKPKLKAALKLQKVENLATSLRFIKSKDIKLVGIGPEDIHDGKTNLVLGLIWTLILRFQIENFEDDTEQGRSAKQALLEWCNKVLNPQGIIVTNFKDSWSDGRGFCGLVNALEPGTIDLTTRTKDIAEENLNIAFENAQTLFQFPKVLDAVDVIENPDELSLMTYVSYFRAFLAANTADPSKTYAEGPGLVEATTGKTALFTVHAVNEEGTKASRGGANVKGFLADASGKEVAKVKVKDNLNGTYECTYVPKAPGGDFVLHVMVGKSDIMQSPFRPLIKPGEPKANKCIAFGPGVEQAIAGQEAVFTIQTKDSSDNPITDGGANIAAVLHDPTGDIKVNIVDNHDGTYTCSYTPHTAKPLLLDIKITTEADGEASIKNCPLKIPVLPGLASAEYTEATGPGTKGATAGVEAPITVLTKDLFGNPLVSGNNEITAVLSSKDEELQVPVSVIDNSDGTYSLSYLPEKAGNYSLSIQLGNDTIKDSPIDIVVKPGAPDLLNFLWDGLELDGSGNRILVAGQPDSFKITAKDGFGNPLTTGGLTVKGSLTGTEDVPVMIADNGDGTYAVSYRPVTVGSYELAVSVQGQPIGGAKNPVPLLVIPGSVSGSHSVAEGNLEEAEIGKENVFTVQTRDEFDNDVKMGGADVSGSLVHESGEVIPISVVDNGDGTYTCTYPDIKKAGTYELTPLVNGQKISDAPFTLSVSPGGTDPNNTIVNLPDHNVAGLPGIQISLHDNFGNLQKKKGDKVRAHLLPLDHLEVDAQDNGDGTYAIDYPPDISGDVEVKVKVNGKYAPTGPFDIAIQENPVAEDMQQEISELLPSSGRLFNTLLKDVSPADRAELLEALKELSKGKRLPPVEEEVKIKKAPIANQPPKFSKPKRDVRKAQANPLKARAELEQHGQELKQEEAAQEVKEEEKPKPKVPVGGVSLGFGALGAQVALKQQDRLAKFSAEQRGESNEVEGKAVEKEELKPEKAPPKGAVRMGPGMGLGMFDVNAAKANLKSNKQ